MTRPRAYSIPAALAVTFVSLPATAAWIAVIPTTTSGPSSRAQVRPSGSYRRSSGNSHSWIFVAVPRETTGGGLRSLRESRLRGGRDEDGPLPVEVALVCVDSPDEFPDLRRLPEAQRVVPQGIEGPVHGVEHAEGVVRLEGANRVFELAGHRTTGEADPPPDIYGSRRELFLSRPRVPSADPPADRRAHLFSHEGVDEGRP